MADSTGKQGVGPADRLQARGEEVRREYGRRLHVIESALVADRSTRSKMLEQADSAICDVARRLRSGKSGFDHEPHNLGREFALTGVIHNIHPSELVRAAGVLFDVVLLNLLECVDAGPDAAQTVASAASALHDSILTQLREASSAYARLLLEEIHEAQMTERRRIARELHDRVGQGVNAANRQLELYQRYCDIDPVRAARKVEAAHEAVREAMESIRRATMDLRLEVQEGSLDKALRHYVDSMDASGVRVEVIVTGDEAWISPQSRDAIFLIVREALRNAFAHSAATTILVQLEIVPHGFYAVVQDDGVGFEIPETVGRGVGLATMRERVALLGGTMGIFSRLGQGTSIRILVPLPGSSDDAERRTPHQDPHRR